MTLGKVFIGTSGWSYNGWLGLFYPENLSKNKWLEYYSNFFNTVEVNSSFYHLPKKQSLKNWAEQTPTNFVFTVKVSRYITHIKKLSECEQSFKKLFDLTLKLGKKLKIFLFQMPPSFKKDTIKLKNFLEILNYQTISKDFKFVFEFRNESWFCSEVYDLLNDLDVGIVISSSPSYPYHEVVTGNICYIRMHGSNQLYSSKYSVEELKKISILIKNNVQNGIDAYVYFNNDINAYAVDNAKKLKELCEIL